MKRLLLAASLALASACSTTISTADYNRSCAADADCVLISTGDVCACGCAQGAIAKSDLAKAQSDRESLSKGCRMGKSMCAPCVDAVMAVCVNSRCEATPR